MRPRRDDDLTACADLVREVHAADRYPRYLPADLTSFLSPASLHGIWVAELDGQIAGHIALVPRSVPAAMELAAGALGRREDQLAVVARLFVAPLARGHGAGRLLLDAAAAEAAARGLWPILDVDTELAAAIALYESRGWTRAGTVTVTFRDGNTLTEHVYLGPRNTSRATDVP
ncbi:GNAT family N-acetyltransferase [Trebonia kvetii]|uniref:GNAT family N-acetyltransferase n=1 Tax=Trebonia kvetii TaxID=2480626 RepID=A0A6P2BQS3_9ACTN|nr:GNAT family N-acetyltransferase [Trebonia kvetii]